MRQNASGHNGDGQNANQNCRGEQNAGHFWDKKYIVVMAK